MAASTPLKTLPIELLTTIATHLPMKDLRNLRLTCKEIEYGTEIDFARRGYKRTRLNLQKHSIRDLATAVQRPGIAAAIRTLEIRCVLDVQVGSFGGGDRLCSTLEAAELFALLAKLPKLNTLRLGNSLDSGTIALRLPPRESPSRSAVSNNLSITTLHVEGVKFTSNGELGDLLEAFGGITTLHLSGVTEVSDKLCGVLKTFTGVTSVHLIDSKLTSAELCTLLHSFWKGLQHVSLTEIVISEGEWYDILQTLKAMQLQRLNIATHRGSGVLAGNRVVSKALRGPNGIEHFWVTDDAAGMIGGNAVEAGLELKCSRLDGH
ncbi:hypothetical protein LTR85_010000 [Meristemomyces frigidus]|nr:hypothetical protein LTR85_010000 [Meristemomyces frigidus]